MHTWMHHQALKGSGGCVKFRVRLAAVHRQKADMLTGAHIPLNQVEVMMLLTAVRYLTKIICCFFPPKPHRYREISLSCLASTYNSLHKIETTLTLPLNQPPCPWPRGRKCLAQRHLDGADQKSPHVKLY